MNLFNTTKINDGIENVGEQLRQARIEKKIILKDAGKKLNMNYKYLIALENNQFEKLPSGVYRKNFLREYAIFLGLNEKELIEMYNKEATENSKEKQKNLFSYKIPQIQYFLTIPKIVKNAIIVIIIFICLTYLGFYLEKIISPPELIITNPADDITINYNSIEIKGFTEQETEININGESVLANKDGYFTKTFDLKHGLNTIIIEAQKKYSKKNIVVKKILVEN
jgi:hypothetical protein